MADTGRATAAVRATAGTLRTKPDLRACLPSPVDAAVSFEKGEFTSYAEAEQDILATCGGLFAHRHLADTFVANKLHSELDKVTHLKPPEMKPPEI